ncbi:MAG: hypothetical protein J6J24_02570 [Clostridia bacterium]|nr:hypothetical protein [Clostridia bacterium]
MIDSKSKLILKTLANECPSGSYKVIDVSDIIMALPRHLRMDSIAIRHILTHLERQDLISIKYDDDNTYCLAILPFGYEVLEEQNQKIITTNSPPRHLSSLTVCLSFIASFLGTLLGIIVCYFALKLF